MGVGTLESTINYVKALSLGQFPGMGHWRSAAWNGEAHYPQRAWQVQEGNAAELRPTVVLTVRLQIRTNPEKPSFTSLAQ